MTELEAIVFDPDLGKPATNSQQNDEQVEVASLFKAAEKAAQIATKTKAGKAAEKAANRLFNTLNIFLTETFRSNTKTKATTSRPLSTQDAKSVRSLQRQIAKHQEKLDTFRKNPTVRKGMEGWSVAEIATQQQARANHLQNEINTFQKNINDIVSKYK